MPLVDFRSDTVTRPTPEMRRAMADAEGGDDVFGDDPTVRLLEEETAAALGKEAALFVPSGTMANQIALGLLAGPGTEVLVDGGAHVLQYEGGAASALWGITLRPVPGENGRISPDQIRGALRPENEHFAPLVAVGLENTHNRAGGALWPREELERSAAAAHDCGLTVHLDGARLWNAAAAQSVPLTELTRDVDTVSVCFSKGLGAPVGSALAADRDRIDRARFLRKRLGGGMRQVGIIAAGALHGLRHHRDRLPDDHRRAARLDAALSELPGLRVLPVQTNIVIVDMEEAGRGPDETVRALADEGLLVVGFGSSRIRLVTHLDLDDAAVDAAIAALRKVLG